MKSQVVNTLEGGTMRGIGVSISQVLRALLTMDSSKWVSFRSFSEIFKEKYKRKIDFSQFYFIIFQRNKRYVEKTQGNS